MKQIPKAFLLLACLCLVRIEIMYAQESVSRRDGNYWTSEKWFGTRSLKLPYIGGLLDGLQLGHYFSYWGIVSKKLKEDCVGQAVRSYDEYFDRYVADVTVGQIVDGLDDFYADYRNRRITIIDATWLVLNGVAGTPKEELDKMIESYRKYSRD
ncbi:MAG: hypothetical protein WBW16_00570 [Bacteroidota bacterium]